jgi:hypothetical protein
MCNRRSATLPAIVAALPEENPLASWLARSGMDHPLKTLLSKFFVDPVLRRLRSPRPKRLGTYPTATSRRAPPESAGIVVL